VVLLVVAILSELFDNTGLHKKIPLEYCEILSLFVENVSDALPLDYSFEHIINLKDSKHPL
jgi:hypothetical protein